jgi:putative Holliday junction resolvase
VKPSRTVLAFDYGRIRIGVAVGQELTAAARPLVTLTPCQQHPDWNAIGRLVSEWQPDVLVVGVPSHADGSPNATTRSALRFSRQLHGRYRLPVDTIDERLSSLAAANRIAATKRGRNETPVDPVAAALILESWFNQQRTNRTCSKTSNV